MAVLYSFILIETEQLWWYFLRDRAGVVFLIQTPLIRNGPFRLQIERVAVLVVVVVRAVVVAVVIIRILTTLASRQSALPQVPKGPLEVSHETDCRLLARALDALIEFQT